MFKKFRLNIYQRCKVAFKYFGTTTKYYFVASYVVTDNNMLTERDVDNDIPH